LLKFCQHAVIVSNDDNGDAGDKHKRGITDDTCHGSLWVEL